MDQQKAHELMKRFFYLAKTCKPEDKVAIIHHRDADGLCSAAIAGKAIERLRGKKPELFLSHVYSDKEAFERILPALLKNHTNKVLIVDMSLDQSPEFINEISEFAQVCLIDHHKIYRDLNSDRVLFIKAQMLSDMEPSRYVCSKLVYDIFGKVTYVEDLDWIAAVGILGDFGQDAWKPFMQKTLKRNKLKMSDLVKLKEIIGGVEVLKRDSFEKLGEEFFKAKKPKALFKSKLAKYAKKLQTELDKLVKDFEKNAEHHPDLQLIFYHFKYPHEIKSPFINKISAELFPNQTVILFQDKGNDWIGFSARRQDFKVAMNDLLQEATKDLRPGSGGGGHIPAAGGRCAKADLEKFKENVKQILAAKMGKAA